MRRFLAAAAATAAALVMPVPPLATAAPERSGCAAAATADEWCFFSAPDDWVEVRGWFRSCQSCRAHGTQGVEQGLWPDYHCEGRPQGLDFYYDLYVPPGS